MGGAGKVHHSSWTEIAALQIVGLIVDEPDGVARPDDTADARQADSNTRRQDPGEWAIDERKPPRAGLGRECTATATAATHRRRAAQRDPRLPPCRAAARADLLTRAPGSALKSLDRRSTGTWSATAASVSCCATDRTARGGNAQRHRD